MYEPSPYAPEYPELAEIPAIKETSTSAIRIQDAVAKRLPEMPGGALQNLYGSNYRQIQQAEEARDIGAASEITKSYNKRSKAIARAKNYSDQKAAERNARTGTPRMKQFARANVKNQKGSARHFARNILGIGTNLYR